MKFLIFFLSFLLIYSLKLYNASDLIKYLKEFYPADENLLINGMKNTIEFLKHYIYFNISSNPPQPDFDESYFPKKDILNMFKNIKTDNTNYFDFKNEFLSAIFQLNDLHISPYFYLIPLDIYAYVCPVYLTTRYNKGKNKAEMYGSFSFDKSYYSFFKNSEHVIQTIENNLNTPIEFINGKDPFTFIQEFADLKIRNKHSTYVFNQRVYTQNNFYIPVTSKELVNFTVNYSNGDSFTTDYIIQDITDLSNDIMFYQDEEDNKKFLSYLSEYNNKLKSFDSKEIFASFPFKSLDDIILEFEKKNNVQSKNFFLTPIKAKNIENDIDWTYSYTSLEDNKTIVFQCRVDEIKQVNVMKINNFGGVSDSIASLDVAEKCAYLFDKNDYRIVIIFPRNGGGNPIIGYNIIELLSPYILTRNTLRIKKDKNIDKFIELYNSYDLFDELNSTDKVKPDYFKDGFVTEKYGDKAEEFSKPFVWRINQKKIEEIKKELKHKRTPTEIVVITDGFALSAASVFMKNVYKSGAGIVIGYNGNPNLPDDIADISQSPSAVLSIQGYSDIFPEIVNNTIFNYKFGIMSLTCIATFHEFQESHVPQEYDVQIPDKRIKIYNSYNDIYYQEFIDEAIEVLDSYKENCSPNHTMLVLFSDECKFDNKLLHGGFGCGNDLKWNKSHCVPVYCDSGYYYNKISNSCIKYPMDNKDKTDDKDNNNYWWIIVFIALYATIFITMAVLIHYKKREISLESNSNINEDLVTDIK